VPFTCWAGLRNAFAPEGPREQCRTLARLKATRDQQRAPHFGASRFRESAEGYADPVALGQGYMVKVEGASRAQR
jgi:hypothetical protein